MGAPAGGAGSGVGLGLRGLVCWRGLWAGARGLGAEGVRVLSGGADAEVWFSYSDFESLRGAPLMPEALVPYRYESTHLH